jgi:hypothetical protein
MIKINLIIALIFLSVIIYASANFFTGMVGSTQLNGEGCACHSLEPSESVNVWLEGPDSVAQGETVQYKLLLAGGPAVRGGFNAASRFNFLTPLDSSVLEIDDELTHSSPKIFSTITDTVSWLFNYTALTTGWDTIYSVSNSTNGNEMPTGDEWNFGEKFPVFVTPPIPVELNSFSAYSDNEKVNLSWSTASEINNHGFEIERSNDKNNFYTVGFVKGNGTTTTENYYSFSDSPDKKGIFYYRLKQVDYNGHYEYSDLVSVDFVLNSFVLSQNYPNPFNPLTLISFSLPVDGYFNLNIYNIQGELIDVISDGNLSSGNHSIEWNAKSFPSGIYFYQMKFESNAGLKFSETRKMVLTK